MAKKRRRPQPPIGKVIPLPLGNEEDRIHARLDEIRIELRRLDNERTELVAQLRARRVPWAEVAEIAGTSRSSAHRKWGASTKPE